MKKYYNNQVAYISITLIIFTLLILAAVISISIGFL